MNILNMTLKGVLSLGRYRLQLNPAIFPVIQYLPSRLPGRLHMFRGVCKGHQTPGQAILKHVGPRVSRSLDHSDVLLTFTRTGSHELLTRAGSPRQQLLTRPGSRHQLLTRPGSRQQLLTSELEGGVCLQTFHLPVGQLRCFHTSSKRCISPLFWLLFKPVAKLGAIVSGRYL